MQMQHAPCFKPVDQFADSTTVWSDEAFTLPIKLEKEEAEEEEDY